MIKSRQQNTTFIYCILNTVFLIISLNCSSQDPDSTYIEGKDSTEVRLLNLAGETPSLLKKVNISVADIPMTEFIRAIATSSGANISVDPKINTPIVNSFNNVRVVDVLIFLKRQYNLNISAIGNIIMIKPGSDPVVKPANEIEYDKKSELLSFNIDGAGLGEVSKKVTRLTGRNITLGSGISNLPVRCFAINLPLNEALIQLAYSNDLDYRFEESGILILEKQNGLNLYEGITSESGPATGNKQETQTFKLLVKSLAPDSLWVYAENAPVAEVIKELSIKAEKSYILTSPPEGNITLNITGDSYVNALRSILTSTGHIFKLKNGIFLIGKNDSPDLMKQELVTLQYRTVDSIMAVVPDDLLRNIEFRVFREQNTIMLSGPSDNVDMTAEFLNQVDILVPVISIEVIIIDYNKSYTISTGIQAGLDSDGDLPPTSGQILSSVNINFNSSTINNLINRFNGFGWAKIGNVTPDFYLALQAMENQGILTIRSTPILSTLNGHKAELSIGDMEYYLEEQINIIGTQNPQSQKIQTYKPVEAELSVIITPVVSGDEQITLEIEVNQSDFTERISTTAPPGKVERTFKSQIRVKNEEMVLLGGLEENRNNKTSNGIPWLSKIPVLKWFFSSRNEDTSKSKLNIFIKPTIIS